MLCVTQEVGYQHGKTVFDVWRRSGVVEKMLKDHHQEEFHNTQSRNNVRKNNSSVSHLISHPLIKRQFTHSCCRRNKH